MRRLARAEGEAIFDLVAGFVNAQTLMALVELRVLHRVEDGALSAADLGAICRVPAPRMQVLLQAGAALGLLKRHRDGCFGLTIRGASLRGVPGLEAMISHHRALYADLADPVAFWRGGQQTELAQFWPYVFGAAGAVDPAVTATYSNLMAESQALIAEDTLAAVDFLGIRRLLDVGGGTGAFLASVGQAHPAIMLDLFDLPAVVTGAKARLASAGVLDRVTIHSGSFQDDPLPGGADAISLVRVLYDHDDSTVRRLLSSVHEALPHGGRLIVSEPMSGGAKPDSITDVYFAIYTMAMQTGRTRSSDEIATMLTETGYLNIRKCKVNRPFITTVITAERGVR